MALTSFQTFRDDRASTFAPDPWLFLRRAFFSKYPIFRGTVNLAAGPGALPAEVMRKAQKEFRNFGGTGVGFMELSHRSEEVVHVIADSEARIKRLLRLEGDKDQFYPILIQGGGTAQFYMVPANLSKAGDKIDYIDTGYWAEKAIAAASEMSRDLAVIASTKDVNYSSVPNLDEVSVRPDAKYLHIASNNTVVGTQFHHFPSMAIPLVVDASSDFLSKPMDLTNIGVLYAHAQKNLGGSGVTIVLIRKNLLLNIPENLPKFFDYRTHINAHSNYHTPPCFAIYVTWLVLQWIEELGGLEALGKINQSKASLLYDFIDDNPFFHCPVDPSSRSQMNVVFTLPTERLEHQFIEEAKQERIIGVGGHRTRGGCRISLYNGVPLEWVEILIDFMHRFKKRHS